MKISTKFYFLLLNSTFIISAITDTQGQENALRSISSDTERSLNYPYMELDSLVNNKKIISTEYQPFKKRREFWEGQNKLSSNSFNSHKTENPGNDLEKEILEEFSSPSYKGNFLTKKYLGSFPKKTDSSSLSLKELLTNPSSLEPTEQAHEKAKNLTEALPSISLYKPKTPSPSPRQQKTQYLHPSSAQKVKRSSKSIKDDGSRLSSKSLSPLKLPALQATLMPQNLQTTQAPYASQIVQIKLYQLPALPPKSPSISPLEETVQQVQNAIIALKKFKTSRSLNFYQAKNLLKTLHTLPFEQAREILFPLPSHLNLNILYEAIYCSTPSKNPTLNLSLSEIQTLDPPLEKTRALLETQHLFLIRQTDLTSALIPQPKETLPQIQNALQILKMLKIKPLLNSYQAENISKAIYTLPFEPLSEILFLRNFKPALHLLYDLSCSPLRPAERNLFISLSSFQQKNLEPLMQKIEPLFEAEIKSSLNRGPNKASFG